jgi:uncharacterized membrane protein YdfJ with MMPL/SSD domain
MRPPGRRVRSLARSIVRHRGWIALAWLVAAVVLLPAARRVANVLEVSARVEGCESAAVERLLSGPLASSTRASWCS